MSTEIQAGDLVVLKSGGPTMTAGKIAYKPQGLVERAENPIVESVECHWFHEIDYLQSIGDENPPKHWGDPRTHVFPASALRKA